MRLISEKISAGELRYWLALLRTPGVGPSTWYKLRCAFPQLKDLFTFSSTSLIKCGMSETLALALQQPDWPGVEKDLAWAAEPYHYIVIYQDEVYPDNLRQLRHAPPLLFVHGKPEALKQLQIAVVGSRQPTPSGVKMATEFAMQLAQAGLTITSGLAKGIDAAAHRGALAANGDTIAVLGCGIDRIYPVSHHKLAEAIVAQGAIISEFPLGTPPLAENFPQRNRLVSGLSQGCLVVEATVRSGSLITANLANEQGREVFALPGSIYNVQAQGCHALIQQGAKLVTSVTDILAELPALTAANPHSIIPESIDGLEENPQKLLECIGFAPTSYDEIAIRSGLETGELATLLLQLELAGRIKHLVSGYIRVT